MGAIEGVDTRIRQKNVECETHATKAAMDHLRPRDTRSDRGESQLLSGLWSGSVEEIDVVRYTQGQT